MPTDTDDQRAAFEAWAKIQSLRLNRYSMNNELYGSNSTQLAYEAWNAALAAQEGGGERVTDGAFRAVFDFAWFLSGQGFNEEIGPSVGTLDYERLRDEALHDFRAAQEGTGNV